MSEDPSRAPARAPGALQQASQLLVDQLKQRFVEQVRRSLGVELDGSETSLAFVDHYLAQARDEDREPIVALLAASAGAYFGEIVRQELGAIWIGDGREPRTLRLLLTHQFVYFAPVDQALEAVWGQSLADDDPRLPASGIDTSFRVKSQPWPADEGADNPPETDEVWLTQRLAELPPLPEDQFHSLTGRYETLRLILGMLAQKHASEGKQPREFSLLDYANALAGPG